MLLNAFSANMLTDFPSNVTFDELTIEQARADARNRASAVGHADTAAVFAAVLDLPVPANRTTVTLQKGDSALLGQYIGPRLPEGATTLPEGATIRWLLVKVD